MRDFRLWKLKSDCRYVDRDLQGNQPMQCFDMLISPNQAKVSL